jgi:hypothetical protein
MQDTIFHFGALTVELDSAGNGIIKVAGKLPTLDEVARDKARARYMVPVQEFGDCYGH